MDGRNIYYFYRKNDMKKINDTWGMSTIDLIMIRVYSEKLNFNRTYRRALRKHNITNGVWAAGGINIWSVIKENIKLFPQFKPEKLDNFLRDWERISDAHDVEYLEGNTFISRFFADYRFSKATGMLCENWAGQKNAKFIRRIIFLTLLKFWGKAYNYKEKKDIYDILDKILYRWA